MIIVSHCCNYMYYQSLHTAILRRQKETAHLRWYNGSIKSDFLMYLYNDTRSVRVRGGILQLQLAGLDQYLGNR